MSNCSFFAVKWLWNPTRVALKPEVGYWVQFVVLPHRSQTGNSTRLWHCLQISRESNMDFTLQLWLRELMKTLQLAYSNNMVTNVDFGWLIVSAPASLGLNMAYAHFQKSSSGQNNIRTCCLIWFDYLSLKKKVSPLICATASKITGSLQMSIGVTGPWVGGKGLPVGTPVCKKFARILNHWGSNCTLKVHLSFLASHKKNTFFFVLVLGLIRVRETSPTWHFISP